MANAGRNLEPDRQPASVHDAELQARQRHWFAEHRQEWDEAVPAEEAFASLPDPG